MKCHHRVLSAVLATVSAAGNTIGMSLLDFATRYGGSQPHPGTQCIPELEGCLGFKVTTNGKGGSCFAWLRAIFAAEPAGAFIVDWVRDTDRNAIHSRTLIL